MHFEPRILVDQKSTLGDTASDFQITDLDRSGNLIECMLGRFAHSTKGAMLGSAMRLVCLVDFLYWKQFRRCQFPPRKDINECCMARSSVNSGYTGELITLRTGLM